MTCPIPPKMRQEMNNNPWYHQCCIVHPECSGRIQWHHNLIYAGKRQNEQFGILPVCEWIHERATRRDIKEQLNAIMVSRMTDADRKKYDHRKW